MELRGLFHPNHSVVLPLFSFIGIGERSVRSSHVHIATLLPCAPALLVRLLYGRCICKHMPKRLCLPAASLHLAFGNMLLFVHDQGKTTLRCAPWQNLQPVLSYTNPSYSRRSIHINPVASATLKTSHHHNTASLTIELNGTFFIFIAGDQSSTIRTMPWEWYPFIMLCHFVLYPFTA